MTKWMNRVNKNGAFTDTVMELGTQCGHNYVMYSSERQAPLWHTLSVLLLQCHHVFTHSLWVHVVCRQVFTFILDT